MRHVKMLILCLMMLLLAASSFLMHEKPEPKRPVCESGYVEMRKDFQILRVER